MDMDDGGEEKATDFWENQRELPPRGLPPFCLRWTRSWPRAKEQRRNRRTMGLQIEKPRKHKFSQIKERETVLDGALSRK